MLEEIMITSIYRRKISRDQSFVAKTTQIDEVLKINNIEINVNLIYWEMNPNGIIFSADYYLPDKFSDFHRLSITIDAVIKSQANIARKYIIERVFPEFVTWIKGIMQLDKASPLYKIRRFSAELRDDEILIHK
jgi:hypothetical protein